MVERKGRKAKEKTEVKVGKKTARGRM